MLNLTSSGIACVAAFASSAAFFASVAFSVVELTCEPVGLLRSFTDLRAFLLERLMTEKSSKVPGLYAISSPLFALKREH